MFGSRLGDRSKWDFIDLLGSEEPFFDSDDVIKGIESIKPLSAVFDMVKEKEIVLIGEASHGTKVSTYLLYAQQG